MNKYEKAKKDKNYSHLGWLLWDAFLFPKGDKERKKAETVYDSLTDEEKERIEDIFHNESRRLGIN